MKKIAVIGAGISGLAVAYFLSRQHRVHLFEKEGRLGGHTHTVRIPTPAGCVPLDTGFLVHNDRTYPNWCGCSGRLACALAIRTCHSRCRADGAASSTAAAAPTGFSHNGGIS